MTDAGGDRSALIDRLRASLHEHYRIERELGRGGMATVFLAEDLKHHRPVALKVLNEEVAAAVGPGRFLREIEISARLTHPHLLPLHDSGEADGLLYYVMPFIEGDTLRERLRREKLLPLEDAIRITCDIADGLAFAHRHDIVHRDIKPENILLQANRAILADFGVARALTVSATESKTATGIIVGTAMYMSPEQALGDRAVDARSDIYSLACVLYEMLIGEPPFTGPSVQAIVARHASERVPSLRLIRATVPAEVEEVITRALAKMPADRYTTVEEFSSRLRAARLDRGDRRRVVGRRRATILAVGGLALAAGAALAARGILGRALREDDWVLVADFEGPPGDQQSANVIRDFATQALQESRFVRVVERRQLNEVMRHAGIPETTFVGARQARELALRSSVRGVLRGGVRRMDSSSYEIALHVVSAEDGASLASVLGTASELALPDTIQELVRRLRRELGERRSSITMNRPLRDVATPSFDAFRKYSAAVDRAVTHGDIPGSNALLLEAIALDSGFASAWVTLGSNYLTARQLDSARMAYGRALAFPHRLSAPEGYRLKGDVAYALERDLAAAVKWYDLYLAEVTDSRSGHSNRAFYRSALGQYDEALADLDRAVQLNPFGPELIQLTLLNQAAILVAVGRIEDARRVARLLGDPSGQYVRLMMMSAESRWAPAESLGAVASANPLSTGAFRINAVTSHASALAAQGAVRAADTVLRDAAGSARGSTARWYERARLLLALSSGGVVPLRSDIVPGDTTPAATMLRALWQAAAGDTSGARVALRRLDVSSSRNAAIFGDGPALIEALIAARGERWRDLVSVLGDAARRGEHDPGILDRPDSFLTRWLIATAYERLGQLDSASAYLSLMLRPTRIPPGHFALRGIPSGFVHHRLGQITERRGDHAAAARHFAAVVAAFQRPDDISRPLLEAARARRTSMARPAGAHASLRSASSSILSGNTPVAFPSTRR